MSIYKELSADQEVKTVTGIQFTIMSPEEIKLRSVAEIVTTDTFNGTEPKIGGLYDPRMGVIEHNQTCKTCEQKTTFCPGHFGHIQLAKPVFYHQFYETVRKILRCVCYHCSGLLKEPEELLEKKVVTKKAPRQKRFDAIYKACTKQTVPKPCNRCGAKQPNSIKREPDGRFTMDWSSKDEASADAEPVATDATNADGEGIYRQTFYAEDVLPILQRINDVDAEFMGFSKDLNRPEWMICSVFPVPPPAVRPSVRTETGQRAEDDLSYKLREIIKTNNMIKQKIEKGATKDQIQKLMPLLQLHVFNFVDNKIPGVLTAKHRTGRPFRVLRERLKGKEGRIRGNLMGKRVDFSARSVITPDPNISIDELGVPTKIAMNITVPETVSAANKAALAALVLAGPGMYPGAKYLHKARENRKINLKSIDRTSIELEEGDVVDRHLRNGDYVLFNRQPSLHKMSMMGHRVRVMPYDTFRVNVCVTKPYNADFDGDEMNAFIPQSIQTENELIMLASVPTQIVSPGKSSPIISVVQDVALGIYRLTKAGVRLTEKQVFNLLTTSSRFMGAVPAAEVGAGGAEDAIQRWTGRQMLSMAIPPNVNLGRLPSPGDDKTVCIRGGKILSGTLTASSYQAATTGLVHTVFSENGPEATRALFDDTQRLICDWLVQSGFSVGISDLILDGAIIAKVRAIVEQAKKDVYAVMHEIHMGTFENATISSSEEHFEFRIDSILSAANRTISTLASENIGDDNRMINMIRAGSKGSVLNVNQMTALLGQQSMEGKRIEYGFSDRTLPHFSRYDDGLESRGFVENSFLKGLSPSEFFFHGMAGREGLIDTAVRTSNTGYIQRKLIKAMEDCKIQHDLTVRNVSGGIVQFLYGEDGMSATKLEKQELFYADNAKTLPELEDQFLISLKDEFKYVLTDEAYTAFYDNPAWRDRCRDHFEAVMADRDYMIKRVFNCTTDRDVRFPVCFPRLLMNTAALFKTGVARVPSDLNPIDVLDALDEMHESLRLVKHAYGQNSRLLGILLRCFLSPKTLIKQYGFGKLAFEHIMQTLKQRFWGGIAHPSEMVGVVSAQSIGEPATQLVLNSVEWNTELLLKRTSADGRQDLERVFIGEFIDRALGSLPATDLEVHGDQKNMELGWIDRDPSVTYEVLSTNTAGRIGWNKVEAVTRHPVVNLDGSATVLRVTLESGREVTATKAKSFLKRVNNEIVGVDGDTIKVGDYLPVSKVLPIGFSVTHWDVSKYLPKTEWLYMSEVKKALEFREACQSVNKRASWYHEHGNKFILPYNRSDIFLAAFLGTKSKTKETPPKRNKDDRSGCVYPINSTYQSAHIPEMFHMDSEFGFFMGAYLAEGCCTEHHVLIANIDDDFNDRIDRFCQTYGIKYHIDDKMVVTPGFEGRSKTLRMHSYVLAQLLIKSCATGAAKKRIPAEMLAGPDDFLKGLIDGYFSGDGCVHKDNSSVAATSVSRGLLEDIQQILVKFGVMSTIRPCPSGLAYALSKGLNAVMGYNMHIPVDQAEIFRKHFSFTIKYKQERLMKRDENPTYHHRDVIPDIVTEQWGTITLKRSEVFDYIGQAKNTADKEILEAVIAQDIVYDKIVKIEEVTSKWDRVYDLTVEDTRNFNLLCGLAQKDTFHQAGQGEATKTVRGVPRLNELLSVSKNIKTPSMIIYLDPSVNTDAAAVELVRTNIQTTHIQDIVKSSAIYYSPSELNSDIGDDKHFIEMYRLFEDITPECEASMTPWLLRLEFDKKAMHNLCVTMADVHLYLNTAYKDTIHCMFSDDNSDKLIFRIKLLQASNSEDILTELKALETQILEGVKNIAPIKGVNGIRKVETKVSQDLLRYHPPSQTFQKLFERYMVTDGSNLQDVLCIPEVDKTRTLTNDVHEVYRMFGIEAARQVLLNEMKACLAEVSPEYRHLSLLVDVMTNKGTLFSIDRHGINRSDIGPLGKCSFEESSEMLVKAGIFAEFDPVKGVSANIILGQIPPCGTGDTIIMVDESKLLSMEPAAPMEPLADAAEPVDDACTAEGLDFNFSTSFVPHAQPPQSDDIVLNVL
jgi:DNA-directed RNA polymerase beta' subunit